MKKAGFVVLFTVVFVVVPVVLAVVLKKWWVGLIAYFVCSVIAGLIALKNSAKYKLPDDQQ